MGAGKKQRLGKGQPFCASSATTPLDRATRAPEQYAIAAGDELPAEHRHINSAEHRHIGAAEHRHINPAKYGDVDPAEHRHNPAKYGDVDPAEHRHVNPAKHEHIKPAKHVNPAEHEHINAAKHVSAAEHEVNKPAESWLPSNLDSHACAAASEPHHRRP